MKKSSVIYGRLAVVMLTISLAGCACTAPENTVTDRGDYMADSCVQAVGQNERVRFLVMHYTALNDNESLDVLTKGQVSAHYLVPTVPSVTNGKPVVKQLVDENKRAWHSGVSAWNGRENLNDTAIGIEIVNPGYTDDMNGRRTWYPFGALQMKAVAILAADIIHRYGITPDNVIGHSDIAPTRKSDPGKLFPWKMLADADVGAWPDEQTVRKYLAGRSPSAFGNIRKIQQSLKRYGYSQIPQTGIMDENTRKTLTAFQMHFRPADIRGEADAETEAIALALVDKYH